MLPEKFYKNLGYRLKSAKLTGVLYFDWDWEDENLKLKDPTPMYRFGL